MVKFPSPQVSKGLVQLFADSCRQLCRSVVPVASHICCYQALSLFAASFAGFFFDHLRCLMFVSGRTVSKSVG